MEHDSIKVKSSIFFVAIRESFISVIPYVVLSSLCLVLSKLAAISNVSVGIFDAENLVKISIALSNFFVFVLCLSISYHLAKRYSVNNIVNIILTISVCVTIEIITKILGLESYIFSGSSTYIALIIPVISTFGLSFASRKKMDFSLSDIHMNNIFTYIYPFLVTYVSLVVLFSLQMHIFSLFNFGFSLNDVSELYLFTFKLVISQILWFFGLHGSNIMNVMIGSEFLASTSFLSNISYGELYDLFVVYGGAGSGLSLLGAIFLSSKDEHSLKVAKLAFPFALFNINEILIFGLPIFFNRQLLIPFLFVPIVNFLLASFVLFLFPVEIVNHSVSWVTPVFFNSYLATGGSFIAMSLQLFLLALGVLIYMPFVTRYTYSQSAFHHRRDLEGRLDISLPLKAGENLISNKAQVSIIEANKNVADVIELLSHDNLMVYYQPKVKVSNNECNEFEALLRVRNLDGSVSGPFFLETLELAGLAPIIDLWVCREVKKNIEKWKSKSFYPSISINLHPDTLKDKSAMQRIELILCDQNVEFEIIERGLLAEPTIKANLLSLKEKGFKISIDDFGAGYSCFETLGTFPIDTIKLDKSLIDILGEPTGYSICEHISKLCADLGFKCVAEGVETQEQYDIISKLNIDYIQGYYFSPAMKMTEVMGYVRIIKS